MSFIPKNFTIWAEIPCADLQRAVDFYSAVFQLDLKIDDSGPNPVANFPVEDPQSGTAGNLYPGAPAQEGAGPTVHFVIPDGLETALPRVRLAGGRVVSEPIALSCGRFAYCIDSEGNSISLFEFAA
ncbi:MAG: VOC family protein [Neomegalonema sp.]|nr:VOC family protein [Neomegalonema sp.]